MAATWGAVAAEEGSVGIQVELQEAALLPPRHERVASLLGAAEPEGGCSGARRSNGASCSPLLLRPLVVLASALGAVSAVAVIVVRSSSLSASTTGEEAAEASLSVPKPASSVIGAAAAAAAPKKPHSLGVAVCVLGQLSRLEVTSKIENIAKPLENVTNVDIFLSLETSGVVYNNLITDISNGHGCHSQARSAGEVKEAFRPYYRGGKFAPHRDEDIVEDRWPHLYKYRHAGGTKNDQSGRRKHIANVLSQMRHQKDCVDLITAHENSTGGRYDIVLKVRDNTLALRPVVPKKLMNVFAVTLKDCSYWWGVHDKVMVLPRKYLERSLGAMYPTMLAIMHNDKLNKSLKKVAEAHNTEQIVQNTLLTNGVPVELKDFVYEPFMRDYYAPVKVPDPDGGDYLPFVDGRCRPLKDGSGDRWCVTSPCKDCWPSGPWTFNVSCVVHRVSGKILNISHFKDYDPYEECTYGVIR